MPFPITITLSSILGTPGPYNLYSNVDSYVTPFETGLTGTILTSSNVPDGTTSIKIKSTGAGCPFELIKVIDNLPTPTPTPTVTLTPTPTPTVTSPPPPDCYGCSDSTFSGSYPSSNYYNYGNYCLDLSSATNGGTITINFSTAGRPNRFTIRPSVGTTTSSGWWGSDYNYAGSHTGNMSGTTDHGSISFVYNNTLTYELQVETTNANPSTLPSDSWDVTILCGDPETEWYQLENCWTLATGYTTGYPGGTYEIEDRVVTFGDPSKVWRVVDVLITNPGGDLENVVSTTPAATGCPISYTYYYATPKTGFTEFCTSPGLVMNGTFETDASSISGASGITPGSTVMYNNDGSTFVGLGSDYYYPITDTAGDNTFDEFVFRYIKIDTNGTVLDIGNISCTGGGGSIPL